MVAKCHHHARLKNHGNFSTWLKSVFGVKICCLLIQSGKREVLDKKNIFVVSLIAVLSALPANAQIASKAYVDDVVPTATSELTNDSGFITSVPAATSSVAGVAQLASGSTNTTAENVANKVTKTSDFSNSDYTTTDYPSMATANAMLNANLEEVTATASNKQPKSSANYQMGKSGGGWTTMTADQQNALNSTVTSAKVSSYDTHIADGDIHVTAAQKTEWSGKQDKLDATAGTGNIKGASGITVTTPKTGDDAGKVVITGPTLATVATSGSYNDLDNKPTIPTTAGDVGAVPTSRTVNGSALSANVTLDGADIALTGYTKPNATSAVAAADTVNAAIGKLEKALDGKQNTIAANTYDTYGAASGVQTAIEGKLDDGASGYDIDAKTLKVQGVDVLTSHQDISGKQDIQIGAAGDAGKAVVVASDGKIGMSANTLGSAAWENAGGSVASGNTGLVTGGTVYTALADKVDTTKVADANGVMVRNTAGTAMKATGTDITVNNGALTVNHATSANSIPNGSENATSYASVWVE